MFGKSGSELAFDLLLMGGWALYAGGFLKRLLSGGGLVELGQVTAVTVFAALFCCGGPPSVPAPRGKPCWPWPELFSRSQCGRHPATSTGWARSFRSPA